MHYGDGMRFGVLGPLEVWTADGSPVRVPELKVRTLLAALLAERGRAVSADALVDHLWGDALPANPANALQAKVSQLRRALDEASPGARDLVVSRRPGYLLAADGSRPDSASPDPARRNDPDTATLDADAFAALVARARDTDDPRTRADLLTDALALWRGRALADFGDLPFARAWADRLEDERLTALEERAEARLALGEHRLLVAELAALAAQHPLRERLHAAHLRALYGAGRQSEALDGFLGLRTRLAEELGVDPGPELLALHQAILAQDPALDPPQAADRPPRRRSNLPTALTTLVGRDQAVRDVAALLADGRLITLTGPAGVGKTRLALATAQGTAEAYPDGVWLVELAGRIPASECVCDVADIAEVIATVLDLRDDIREDLKGAVGRSNVSVVERLAAALRGRDLLLVLDNCEHVIQPAADVVAALLSSGPGLTVLATSQEALAVPGEVQWPVPPLSLPAAFPRARRGGGGGTDLPGHAGEHPADAGRLPGAHRGPDPEPAPGLDRVYGTDAVPGSDRAHGRGRVLGSDPAHGRGRVLGSDPAHGRGRVLGSDPAHGRGRVLGSDPAHGRGRVLGSDPAHGRGRVLGSDPAHGRGRVLGSDPAHGRGRVLGSDPAHGRGRVLGSDPAHGRGRVLGSDPAHGRGRVLGSDPAHGRGRVLGSDPAHGRGRVLGSDPAHGRGRVLGSDPAHGRGRVLGSDPAHGRGRVLGSDPAHGRGRVLGSDPAHGRGRVLGSDPAHGRGRVLGSDPAHGRGRVLGSDPAHATEWRHRPDRASAAAPVPGTDHPPRPDGTDVPSNTSPAPDGDLRTMAEAGAVRLFLDRAAAAAPVPGTDHLPRPGGTDVPSNASPAPDGDLRTMAEAGAVRLFLDRAAAAAPVPGTDHLPRPGGTDVPSNASPAPDGDLRTMAEAGAVRLFLDRAAAAAPVPGTDHPPRPGGTDVPSNASPAPDGDLRTMAEAGAVRLFLDRAAAAAPGFVLDADTAPAVATIVRRLDGIPLALELAATRVRALGVHELAARLDDRFRVLAAGRRGGPARQQTLRAAIDWSWDLLGGPERAVLRRLAVHADGSTLDAAEQVCAGGEVASADVADALARLVDRSLVTVAAGTRAAGRPRYRLLESVAEYCLERLREADEFAATADRHHRYFADLAVRAEPHLRGPEQRRWLERLDAENANLRRAVEHAAAHGDAAGALRLAAAATWPWYLRGRPREARRALDAALSASGDAPEALRTRAVVLHAAVRMAADVDPSGLAPARNALATLDGAGLDADAARDVAYAELLLATAFWWYGDSSDSRGICARALATLRGLGDQWGIAVALSLTAYGMQVDGDLAACRRYAEESHRLFTRLGDRWGVLRAGDTLGNLAEVRGDYAEAAAVARDGLRIAEELGLWAEYSGRLALLGRYALLAGDFAEADAHHEGALRIAHDLDDEPAAMFAEMGLALAARRQGRFADAERILLRWRDWSHANDGPPGVAITAAELGFIGELRGDAAEAERYHREGLSAARRVGDPRMLALAYEGLAGVGALAGDPARAAALLGAAHRARTSTGHPLAAAERADVDRIESSARKALGDEAYDAAFATGFAPGSDIGTDVEAPAFAAGATATRWG